MNKATEKIEKVEINKDVTNKEEPEFINTINPLQTDHTFKPNTKFLTKIIIDEDFLIKHIKQDPPIEIDFSIEVQSIELSRDKIMTYVVTEFFIEILRFNDKRNSKHFIDNVPSNQIILNTEFELESNLKQTRFINIWLKLLKPTQSNISKERLLTDLTKDYSKCMEPVNYSQDPDFRLKALKNESELKKKKAFNPFWRLGARDVLLI